MSRGFASCCIISLAIAAKLGKLASRTAKKLVLSFQAENAMTGHTLDRLGSYLNPQSFVSPKL